MTVTLNMGSTSWVVAAQSSPAENQNLNTKTVESKSGLSPGVMLRLSRATYIQDVSEQPGNVVYVFMDPECPFCRELWKKIHAMPATVQVRYLVVAVIRKSSWGKAAAILQPRDRAQALRKHETMAGGNGIHALREIAPDIRESIELNNLFLDVLKIPGTPGIVYTDAEGSVRAYSGVPPAPLFNAIFSP